MSSALNSCPTLGLVALLVAVAARWLLVAFAATVAIWTKSPARRKAALRVCELVIDRPTVLGLFARQTVDAKTEQASTSE